jgi:hypothetical protein
MIALRYVARPVSLRRVSRMDSGNPPALLRASPQAAPSARGALGRARSSRLRGESAGLSVHELPKV